MTGKNRTESKEIVSVYDVSEHDDAHIEIRLAGEDVRGHNLDGILDEVTEPGEYILLRVD